MTALAALLSGCASPAPSAAPETPVAAPGPASSETAVPVVGPIARGEQVVPAGCDELIPDAQARLRLDFGSSGSPSVGTVIRVTGGALACATSAVAADFDVSVHVLAGPPEDWRARPRDAGGAETNGALVERICSEGASYCAL